MTFNNAPLKIIVSSPEEWTYDPLGNRLTDTGTGEAQWEYNKNNELLNSIDHHHEYDANGSLIAERDPDGSLHRSFEYNAENRMSAVRDRQGRLIAEYRYDPFGRRIQATVHNPPGTSEPETTWYVYSDQGLMAELDESGIQQDFYLFAPEGLWSTDPILRKSGSTYYYYQTDHLGTPQQLIDQMGNVVHSREMRAFGETAQTGIDDRWRFPGQLASTETGLYYNYFRDFEPSTGRYVQSDPIGLDDGLNLYLYVQAMSVTNSDPKGRSTNSQNESDPDHTWCSYYSNMANRYNCRYYETADKVCRDGNWIVNGISGLCGISQAQKSCIRKCLVLWDKGARQQEHCKTCSFYEPDCCEEDCVSRSCIDDYHNYCFFECGVYEGGNLR